MAEKEWCKRLDERVKRKREIVWFDKEGCLCGEERRVPAISSMNLGEKDKIDSKHNI